MADFFFRKNSFSKKRIKSIMGFGDGGSNSNYDYSVSVKDTLYNDGVTTTNLVADTSFLTVGTECLLGYKTGVNFNVTTDTIIPITMIGTKKCLITRIVVGNASISLTTAAGGVYTAASKGGTAVVAASQAYTALTTSAKALNLTLAVNEQYSVSNLYFALTTAQGAAATADIYVFGIIMP